MAFFEYFPLDHAVQINYDANGNETSRETKTSGKVHFGYERYVGSYPIYQATSVPSHIVQLWFKIPSDAYKYWYISRFFWYTDFGVNFEDDYYEYYYYVDYSSSPSTFGSNVTTGKSNYNSSDATNNIPCLASTNPTNYSITSTARTYGLQLTESAINSIQLNNDEYIVVELRRPTSGLQQRDENYFYQWTQLHEIDLDIVNFGTDATNILLNVTPVYPVNVYARNDRDLVVDWDFSNNINRSSTYLYQDSAVVTITDKNGDSIEAEVSDDTSQVVFDVEDLEDLAVGECSIEIVVTSNYDTTGTGSCLFELVGETDAPEITSVTQNSYPTITWTSTSQIAWELQISDVNGIVYKKNMTSGTETSFTVPKLLNDGAYSIEMRYMNTYGIISEWGSYFLNLAPTKPSAPEGIIVSARADFGISINCDAMETTGKLLAVRRKDSESEEEILGEYNGSFIDYLVGLDDPHEYTIRNYVEGYTDGDWIDGVLSYSGVVIRDADDYSKYVHVWMSEDKTLKFTNNDERSDVLTQCVGRKYPVSEIGEWLTTERSFVGYVSYAEFKKLQKMKIESSHVLMQSKEEYFPCYMSMSDQGKYNDGRIVSITLTRIDGEK